MTSDPIFVPRSFYNMPGPLGPGQVLRPAKLIVVHHDVIEPTDDPCRDFRRTAGVGVRRFGRASYSYMFHRSGVVGEMQGDRIGAHTAGHNSISYGLVLGGRLQDYPPTREQILSACWMIHVLRSFRLVVPRPLVMPHEHMPGAATACPSSATDVALPYLRAVAADPTWSYQSAAA